MVELKTGELGLAAGLPELIFMSAPDLLSYLFESKDNAIAYLHMAASEKDGQFSVFRHHLATLDGEAVGSISLWDTELPESFQQNTLASLRANLSPSLLLHVIAINPLLVDAFAPPLPHQLCLGHLAVLPSMRGQGIASKLMAWAVRQAKQRAKQELALDVSQSNQAAIAFYQRWDFMVQSERVFAPLQRRFYRMVKLID